MNFKVLFLLLLVTVTVSWAGVQKRILISTSELKNLAGCWQGTLQYSGTMIRKPYSTKAELIIKRINTAPAFLFLHVYSQDSSDRTFDTLSISANKRKLEGATIISKKLKKNGTLVIITEAGSFDHDTNQQAFIRQTYTIGKKTYTYTKKIKLKGQAVWMDREAFSYEKIPCRNPPLP